MNELVTKTEAGYQLAPNTQYVCADCAAYDADDMRCVHLRDIDVVLPLDGSNYFEKGEPESLLPRPGLGRDADGDSAAGLLTPQQIGLVHSNFGFSCKRCVNFIVGMFDCRRVDRTSPGDTPGMIHPDACCNLHKMDPVRGQMPTEAFREEAA